MPKEIQKEKNNKQIERVNRNAELIAPAVERNVEQPVQEKKPGFFSRLFGRKTSKVDNVAKQLEKNKKRELKEEKERKKAMSKKAQKARKKEIEKQKTVNKLSAKYSDLQLKAMKTRNDKKRQSYHNQMADIETNLNRYRRELEQANREYLENTEGIKRIEENREKINENARLAKENEENARIMADIQEFEIVQKPNAENVNNEDNNIDEFDDDEQVHVQVIADNADELDLEAGEEKDYFAEELAEDLVDSAMKTAERAISREESKARKEKRQKAELEERKRKEKERRERIERYRDEIAKENPEFDDAFGMEESRAERMAELRVETEDGEHRVKRSRSAEEIEDDINLYTKDIIDEIFENIVKETKEQEEKELAEKAAQEKEREKGKKSKSAEELEDDAKQLANMIVDSILNDAVKEDEEQKKRDAEIEKKLKKLIDAQESLTPYPEAEFRNQLRAVIRKKLNDDKNKAALEAKLKELADAQEGLTPNGKEAVFINQIKAVSKNIFLTKRLEREAKAKAEAFDQKSNSDIAPSIMDGLAPEDAVEAAPALEVVEELNENDEASAPVMMDGAYAEIHEEVEDAEPAQSYGDEIMQKEMFEKPKQ